MSKRGLIAMGLAIPIIMAQAPAPRPFAVGDIFIDSNGDTDQITECRGTGWQMECQVRRLAASGRAPIDPGGRWWSVDTLRGSERQWIANGGAPYRGPALPLATAQTRAPAAPSPRTPAVRVAAGAPVAPAAGGDCPKTPYGGRVPGTRPASAALFQQKIADSITMGSYGRGWYGVRLANFRVGGPIRNVMTSRPGFGAVRVNTGAPANATMYPVSTTMTVCEGWPGGSGSRRTSDKKYLCFVSAGNEWTCGASN